MNSTRSQGSISERSARSTISLTRDILRVAADESLFPDFMNRVLDIFRRSLDADEVLIVTGPGDKRTCYHVWREGDGVLRSMFHNAPPPDDPADALMLLKSRLTLPEPDMPSPYIHQVKLQAADSPVGMLVVTRTRIGFSEADRSVLDGVAESLSVAMVHFINRAALTERVKELTCLYRTAQIASDASLSIDEILKQVLMLLPPAWHYPEITEARMTLDDRTYTTPGFTTRNASLKAPLVVNGRTRGEIEVVYLRNMPVLDEGPFLKEERNLINTLAHQLSVAIERREAEEQQRRLQEQLRHADRLATIGKLAAGVAHELNEPLGNVLGFAQLAARDPALPDQVRSDLERIETAALHGREIVRKLMLFARQTPPKTDRINLNQVIHQALSLLENRLTREGIRPVLELDDNLPHMPADPSQMVQVVINLVINAIQAMPDGGELTLKTGHTGNTVILTVSDTGTGMSPEVKEQIFLPFFTTKDVNEGTGLGLAVVHGIVQAHRGNISVESCPGAGTTFTITLPAAEGGEPEGDSHV